MTIGAKGVKTYNNISNSYLVNFLFNADFRLTDRVSNNHKITYSIGKDDKGNYLPLISPVPGITSLMIETKYLSVDTNIDWALRQRNYSSYYGETPSDSYYILNAAIGYKIRFNLEIINLKCGVENILDRKYSTYSDINHIWRKGRNVFLSITLGI